MPIISPAAVGALRLQLADRPPSAASTPRAPRIHRTLQPGEPVPNCEPRRRRLSHGYILLSWRVGVRSYVVALEHRFVMGMPPKGTIVHHRNHDKSDNRPENLEVLGSRAEHNQHHPTQYTFDVDEAVRLGRAGQRARAVATTLGVSPQSIRRVFKRNGIPTRPQACRQGHARSPENTRITPAGNRECRVCQREWQRRHYAVKRSRLMEV